MDQYIRDNIGAPAQMLRHLVVFGSLLFSVGVLSFYPFGSALMYYTDLLAVLSLVYLFLARHEIDWPGYGKSFIYCCAPFLPLLLVYVAVKVYHGVSLRDDGIFFSRLVYLLIASGLVFGVLAQSKRISRELFFGCCAIGTVAYFLDISATAWLHGVPVWRVKSFVKPYSTMYAHCVSLIAGLSLLGYFMLPRLERKLRYTCFGASLLGFCSTIGFMGIRSVILSPLIALLVGYCVSPLKIRTKVLTLILFGVLATVIVVQSPIVARMRIAYSEAVNVMSNDAVAVVLPNVDKQDVSPREKKLQKYLNTSVGARIAVCGIAERALKDHMWLGTGKGRPHNFVDTKKLFKYSQDYLKHFHSDYVQVTIVGGIVLLFSFLATQLWLLIRSFKNPLTLYMTLNLMIYGLVDSGMLNRRILLCYLGAGIIIWSWHYVSSQSQGIGENGTT